MLANHDDVQIADTIKAVARIAMRTAVKIAIAVRSSPEWIQVGMSSAQSEHSLETTRSAPWGGAVPFQSGGDTRRLKPMVLCRGLAVRER
jgi:hypothetical protein